MVQIDIHKVGKMFEIFRSYPVSVEVVGTIRLPPFYIHNFDWYQTDEEICFGNFEEYDNWFRINFEELEGIYTDYNLMTHEDKIVFEIEYDIFRTNVEVIFDCEME